MRALPGASGGSAFGGRSQHIALLQIVIQPPSFSPSRLVDTILSVNSASTVVG